MSNRVLEYIIRALDFTKSGTSSAKRNVQSMSKESSKDIEDMRKKFAELQDGCDDLAKKTKELSMVSDTAKEKMIGLAGAIGSVFVAFKVGWDIGKKINEWISPTMRLAAAWDKVSAAVERSKKIIAEKTAEHKAALEKQSQEYGGRRDGLETAYRRRDAMREVSRTSISIGAAESNVKRASDTKTVIDEEVSKLEQQLLDANREKKAAVAMLPERTNTSLIDRVLKRKELARNESRTKSAINAYSVAEGKIANIETELKDARARQEAAGFEVNRSGAEFASAKSQWNKESAQSAAAMEAEELAYIDKDRRDTEKKAAKDAKKAADRRKVLETQRTELLRDLNQAVAQEKADRLNSLADTMRIEARRRFDGGPRTNAEFENFLGNQIAGKDDAKEWSKNDKRYEKVLGKVFSGKRLTGSEKKFMDEMNAFNVAKGMQAKAEALSQEAQKATVESKRTLEQINGKLTFLEAKLQGN